MLIIDSNEPSWVKNHDWGPETRIEQLPVGDFLVGNQVLIERKEINDFVKSMEQRLWEQCYELESELANEQNSIMSANVIVHGTTSNLSTQNMDPRKIKAIYGAQARIIVSYDIGLHRYREKSQFIQTVERIHDKVGTGTDKTKPHLTKRRFRDDRINILYGVEGIGQTTAENLLDGENGGFRSVAEVAQASVDRLQDVDNVGPKTADDIYNAFHEGEEGGLI